MFSALVSLERSYWLVGWLVGPDPSTFNAQPYFAQPCAAGGRNSAAMEFPLNQPPLLTFTIRQRNHAISVNYRHGALFARWRSAQA
jgi:hypothetical protein